MRPYHCCRSTIIKVNSMTTLNFVTVDHYIALQPKATQKVLELARRAIRKAVPQAEEALSYKMPTFELTAHCLLIHSAGVRRR